MLFYRLARGLFRIIAVPLFRFRVEGAQLVPAEGPAVVVAKHRSWLDPACVGAACPRPIRFLILDRVYDWRPARWFYRMMRTIPVTPGGRQATPALRAGLRALQAGQLVGIFPEGRVIVDDADSIFHPGVALLAIRSGAPVIPIWIRGSDRAWPHGRRWPGPAKVLVRVGESLTPPAETDRDAVETLLARIRHALDGLSGAEDPG